MNTTSYHVEIVGTLWMGCTAAMDLTIKADELGPDNELSAVERYVDTHAGDFFSVEALRVVKLERRVSGLRTLRSGFQRQTIDTRETELRAMTAEQEDAYLDCMSPDLEDA